MIVGFKNIFFRSDRLLQLNKNDKEKIVSEIDPTKSENR